MPSLSPFRGIRYDPAALGAPLARLVAPPYDVIDEDERAALEAAHPANAVRLILPRDDQHPGDRYAGAAARLARWLEDGTLVRDPRPRLYAHEMRFTDPDGVGRTTLGVLGALRLPERVDGGDVLPHEHTSPKAKSDRLDLLRATRANLDPIWLLSLAPGLTDLLGDGEPLGTCTDDAGVEHALRAIDDPRRIEAVRAAVGSTPAVLADGHHRFETAVAYRDELVAAGTDPGDAAAMLALVVELAPEQLCIEPIHRVLRLPDGVDPRERLAAVAEVHDVAAEGSGGRSVIAELGRRMSSPGGIGLVDRRGTALLVPRPEAQRATDARWPAPASETDAALVDAAIVPSLPGAEVAYRHSAADCAGLVAQGSADAALLLRPVTVARTRAAALAGVRMPQKTTFFWPKPRTGLVLRAHEALPPAPPGG